MTQVVEFFFDVGSPASYLAWTQLRPLCEEFKVDLVYKPMLLGGVYQATGNSSPATIAVKGRYVQYDYERCARRYGVPLVANPHFPVITLFLMRVVVGVQINEPDRFQDLLTCIFKAMWVDALNLNEPEWTDSVFLTNGFDPAEMKRLSAEPEVKAVLRANTEEAVARGVFGSPTTFIGDEMFFGQDRMSYIRDELYLVT